MVVNGLPTLQHERQQQSSKASASIPPRLQDEPMAGFIFVCNDETITEDFDRRLFGLPKAYLESVKAITKGMPLFLYNYSTRILHGVFEAVGEGGMNLEPYAWENKDVKPGAERVSKFPAQVRFRIAEFKAPLEEERFRPFLYHYEPRKFRLELTHSEVSDLLKLFNSQRLESSESEWRGNGTRSTTTPPILNGPPLLSSPRKRVLNGYEGRADVANKWRSNGDSLGRALDNVSLQEADDATDSTRDAAADCSRGSYVAALKSGIRPGFSVVSATTVDKEIAENGRCHTPRKSTGNGAILARFHDPDPAVNSEFLLPSPSGVPRQLLSDGTTKRHQPEATLRNSNNNHRMQGGGKLFHEFRRPKEDNNSNNSRKFASSLPLIQLHHPHPVLAPIRFPVYAADGFGYRPIQRNDRGGGDLSSSVQPGVWPPPQPVLLLGPQAFSLPPPGLAANVESNFEVLHSEILEFAQTARPSPCLRARAEAAVDCVRRGVKSLWPGADVEVFGSFATGLCLPHSDVDVVVLDVPTPEDAPIRSLAAQFRELDWCEWLITIETAAMPVIKLRCNPSPELGASSVAIDVTLGGKSGPYRANKGGKRHVPGTFVHNGAAAREFVIEKLRQLPALAPLVLLMKSYLQHKGLNDVYTGGLGSFSLTLMLVFYLEQVPVSWSSGGMPAAAVVQQPSEASAESSVSELSDSDDDTNVTDSTSTSASEETSPASFQQEALITRAWRIVDELLASLKAPGAPSLGSLLIGFLHIFGQEFDFSRTRIVLKGANGSSGGMFTLEPTFQPTCLWIDDPLRPGMNVGAGSFAMCNVQGAMRDMLFVLAKPQTALNVFDRPEQQERRYLPHLDQLFQVVI